MGRPRRSVFGSSASCLSDSEFLPGWKKCPGVAEKMIKAEYFFLIKGEPAFAYRSCRDI
jgi:hypothetical protein